MNDLWRWGCAGLLLVGCSTTVTGNDAAVDAGSDGPPAVDAARDGSADAPAVADAGASRCPSTQPADGVPCTTAITCEYGTDPRRECRAVVYCDGTVWRVQPEATPSEHPWCASPPPAAQCPATLDAAGSCAAPGAVCTVGGSFCECTPCVAFPVGTCTRPPVWQCNAAPAGCPAVSPRLGDACANEGRRCEYGCNSPGGALQCTDGVWVRGTFENCPISTRRLKRDIAYVSPAEADALAAQLRATRLATYFYEHPGMDGQRRRLGFILEDQPHGFAVDPERSQVDLYGFTSLLVATVQSQDRTIRALERRVTQLEGRAPGRGAPVTR